MKAYKTQSPFPKKYGTPSRCSRLFLMRLPLSVLLLQWANEAGVGKTTTCDFFHLQSSQPCWGKHFSNQVKSKNGKTVNQKK